MSLGGGISALKALLEEGFKLFKVYAKEVLQLFGLPLLWAGSSYHFVAQNEGTRPSYIDRKIMQTNDFSVPEEAEILVSDIKASPNWACWCVSLGGNLNIEDICQPLSYSWKSHMKMLCKTNLDSDEELELHFDNRCEGLRELNESFDDLENDLEIVFDDGFDSIDGEEIGFACFPPYLQSCQGTQLIRDFNTNFDEIQDICLDKILPCVTKECISLKVTDVLSCATQNIVDFEKEIITKDNGSNPCLLKTQYDVIGIGYVANEIKTSKKSVSFAREKDLIKVHQMVQWDFAYRKARKGCWETYACDRSHFRRRIACCEQVLNPVLEKKYQEYLNSCM